jgi:hypothetical protein
LGGSSSYEILLHIVKNFLASLYGRASTRPGRPARFWVLRRPKGITPPFAQRLGKIGIDAMSPLGIEVLGDRVPLAFRRASATDAFLSKDQRSKPNRWRAIPCA